MLRFVSPSDGCTLARIIIIITKVPDGCRVVIRYCQLCLLQALILEYLSAQISPQNARMLRDDYYAVILVLKVSSEFIGGFHYFFNCRQLNCFWLLVLISTVRETIMEQYIEAFIGTNSTSKCSLLNDFFCFIRVTHFFVLRLIALYAY